MVSNVLILLRLLPAVTQDSVDILTLPFKIACNKSCNCPLLAVHETGKYKKRYCDLRFVWSTCRSAKAGFYASMYKKLGNLCYVIGALRAFRTHENRDMRIRVNSNVSLSCLTSDSVCNPQPCLWSCNWTDFLCSPLQRSWEMLLVMLLNVTFVEKISMQRLTCYQMLVKSLYSLQP